ncbi:hypothetical protein CARUB_v10019529mg [Capsella rubella]|uniref:Uncharacterized protein n=1 Tax=Capsella rubella TaxID=81985 RepID=R0HDV3_9BRAS|nr:hypothetical protein CARUB_v10019529mg [Capsella rubella]
MDFLKNMRGPAIDFGDDASEPSSDSEAESDAMEAETARECSFFGHAANYIASPINLDLDLRVPLQAALEDLCLNFASFNRDDAPVLDEQREEGKLLTRNISNSPTVTLRFSLSLTRGFASSRSYENDVVIIGGGHGGHVAAIMAA